MSPRDDMEGGNGSRTHEPSLRELTAELDGLRELLNEKIKGVERVMDERDTRYAGRFEAMDEKTSLALESSKEAVLKAETATEKRFEGVNEFRGTLSDQAANLLPRSEAAARFGGIDDKIEALKEGFSKEISSLRESRSESGGERLAHQGSRQQNNWVIGILVGLGIAAMQVLLHFWK
jgi:hypothetical protein